MHIYTIVASWIENPFRRTSEHNHIYNYLNFSFFALEIIPFINKIESFFEQKLDII